MYKIDKNTTSPDTGVSYIEAGIDENLELAEVVYKHNEDTDTRFIAFYWEDSSKARVSKTEWEPKAPRVNPDGFIKTEADALKALEDKKKNQAIRIKHMLVNTGILTEDELDVSGSTFEEYANAIIKAIGTKNKGKKARLKVVYDNNNYTTLPSVAKNLDGSYCWAESMDVSKEDSKIKILGMDKMSRVTHDDIQGEESPFETKDENNTVDTAAGSDDLPF